MGLVTKDSRIIARDRCILIKEDICQKPWQYKGAITNTSIHNARSNGGGPIIYDVSKADMDYLEPGDVVLLGSDGRVTQLWDISSPHNSILITEECNSQCIMCPQPSRKDKKGLYDFNCQLIKLLDPKHTTHIGITGGEPTLKGEQLFGIIRECKKRLPRAAISLLSNGRKFSDFDFTKELASIGHQDLTICIPLYSDNDNLHDRIVGVEGAFEETIYGINHLALFRQKIELRNVVTAMNHERLTQYADYIYRNFPFLSHIALMGMETTGLAKRNLESVWVEPSGYQKQLGEACLELNRRGMSVSIYNIPLCFLPRGLWQYCRQSISTWKNVYLSKCDSCKFKEKCCGFFNSYVPHYEANLSPISS